ncbi:MULTISPECIES: hypothetical protein [Parachlamydia]|jgi:hypothetical protein|uniref:Uncharacterized protein n=2 Tax=Parachlamydia acanthamoebae TaxID=83552 RepID=F8KY39_PARAV|nr:hypothetical protein [Parachlamydia acanthamoebae]EFB40885.1 hypothetical protein pah_c180o077 [Parachlamydia acanthamoebae str. Hall's coccus]CCB85787.1 putative uncharacterized protein [Parachlamydia acanthamoebae UV-7]
MESFLKEFDKGEALRIRDQLQFEIKSNFYSHPDMDETTQTQEFYFFIPNSLQVNKETYTREQFYQDQTNLVRFKTPVFTIEQLLNMHDARSPLTRLKTWAMDKNLNEEKIEDELKLFGNIVRSSIRQKVKALSFQLDANRSGVQGESVKEELETFMRGLDQLIQEYLSVQKKYSVLPVQPVTLDYFAYVEEFVSNVINYYLTVLLEKVRFSKNAQFAQLDAELCDFILQEKKRRQERNQEPEPNKPDSLKNEFISYQNNLSKKFVMTALFPEVTRFSSDSAIKNLIGSFSAGIAMFFYLLLFIWGGNVFVINSFPFVLITVAFYILKDRLKEGLKTLSYRQTLKWFPDYTTKIRFRSREEILGTIRESFTFVDSKSVPSEIVQVRNKGFHSTLESFKRPETVFYYKKVVNVQRKHGHVENRRHELHNLFRFNIDSFLRKASNPYYQYITVDPETHQVGVTLLPKVYHLNIILKNTYQIGENKKQAELKKFRLILDKTGIKRIEELQ